MAWAAMNPIIINWAGNSALPRTEIVAENSKTWKKGEFGFLTSGTVTPVAGTGKTDVTIFRFCETQITSTSTSTVWVQRIRTGTQMIMAVMDTGVAAAIAQSNIGTKYGIEGLSNVTYLDLNTSSGPFEVIDLMSLRDPIMNSVQSFNGDTGVAGWAIVEFTGTVS